MKNLKKAGQKRSRLEKSLNRFVFAAFILNLMLLVSSVLLELNEFYRARREQGNQPEGVLFQWYLGLDITSISPSTVFIKF
jgi:hypothetical protein